MLVEITLSGEFPLHAAQGQLPALRTLAVKLASKGYHLWSFLTVRLASLALAKTLTLALARGGEFRNGAGLLELSNSL